MKANLPRHEHYSYLQHRKQRTVQIILPVVLSALCMAGLIVLISISTFGAGGDVGRWAAISTIWIIIPLLLAGLVTLALLAGLIVLMSRILQSLPTYTAMAQDYVYIAKGYILRGADMAVKPVLALNDWIEKAKAFAGRMKFQ